MTKRQCECNSTKILEGQTYQYTDIGMDNVYLQGIKVEKCKDCGAVSPFLPRIIQLHKTIAQAIVLQSYFLSGAEIRFLRKERGLKAKEFAVLLRIDPATLSRWENDEQARNAQNDALVRYVYVGLYNDQEGKPFPEKVTSKIAVVNERKNNPSIWINTANLTVYEYRNDHDMAIAG